MRNPRSNENLIGKVCMCAAGRLGLVTHKVGNQWRGQGLDGRLNWLSVCPLIIAEDLKEYSKKKKG